jgi:rubrerythrin
MEQLLTADQLFGVGVEIEKNGRTFYASVREAVAEGAGKAEVEQLIHEELTHIGFLTRELQKIKTVK